MNNYAYYTARDRALEKLRGIKLSQLRASDAITLKQKLSELRRKLPKTGRLQYSSQNIAPLKKEIDEAVNLLIRSNPDALAAHIEMQRQFALKEAEVRKIAGDNKLVSVNGRRLTKDEITELVSKGRTRYVAEKSINLTGIDYIDKLRLDYQTRLGNHVLGLVKGMEKEYRNPRRAKVNDKGLKIKSRRKRKASGQVLQKTIQALDLFIYGVRADFTKSLKQIEREMEYQSVNG